MKVFGRDTNKVSEETPNTLYSSKIRFVASIQVDILRECRNKIFKEICLSLSKVMSIRFYRFNLPHFTHTNTLYSSTIRSDGPIQVQCNERVHK